MLALDPKGTTTGEYTPSTTNVPANAPAAVPVRDISETKTPEKAPKEVNMDDKVETKTPDNEDDIPF